MAPDAEVLDRCHCAKRVADFFYVPQALCLGEENMTQSRSCNINTGITLLEKRAGQ